MAEEEKGFFSKISDIFSEDSTDNNQNKEDKETKEKARANHQAFLMFNHEVLTADSKAKSQRFQQFAQIEHPEPAEINNILFKKPVDYDILLQSRSPHLSYFVPKIRIFKQYPVSLNENIDIELPIAQQYTEDDFQSIFRNKEGRGGGVGIKSFKWSTIGNSPGNQYSFGSELELVFESIGEISKIRSVDNINGTVINTSFEDLLIQKKGPNYTAGAEYNIDYYRIKAEIGWSIPPNNMGFVPQEMIEELKYSNLTLFMGLHSHEIDIADDSTVTLKLKYISYIEALTDNAKNSNIFFPALENFESLIQGRRSVVEQNAKKLKDNPDAGTTAVTGDEKKKVEETIKEAEAQIAQKENENKTQIYSRFLNYIYTKKMIKYLIVKEEDFQKFTSIVSRTKDKMSSKEQIEEYNKEIQQIKNNNIKISPAGSWPTGPSLSVPDGDIKKLTEQTQIVTENYNKVLIKAAKALDKEIVIPYFHLGDLLEAVLQEMYNGGPTIKTFFEKQLKVLLGPIIYYDYGRLVDNIVLKPNSEKSIGKDGSITQTKIYTGSKTVINIADIPISLDIYTAWFTNKIVDAGVTNKSFRDFIGDILTDLVIRANSDTYSFAPRQKTRLVYKTKTLSANLNRFSNVSEQQQKPASFGQAASSGQTSTPTSLRFPATSLKLYESLMSEDKSKVENILLIYAVSDQQFELKSDYEVDKKRGIRHVFYGAETGLVKNIKFSRQDNPLIRSHNMRMVSQQNSDKSIILREVYNANLEMYGNSLFEIGELIYISPTLFGSNTSVNFVKNLGIGGYFMILKIDNNIQDGSYVTSLELKWNAKGDGVPLQINDGLIQ